MNVGLVLSGGMAKGAYEVGALKAVSEFFAPEDIRYISAASVGALNSFAYACGELDLAYELWRGINRNNEKLFISTAVKSESFKRSIYILSGKKPFCDKLYVPLFNLKSRSNYYFDLVEKGRDELEGYLRASVAFIPICRPVCLNGKYYYDGAVIDNIPVYPLYKHSLDFIICIYFDEYNYLFESEYFDNKVVKISLYNKNEVLNKSIWFTRESTEQMFADGYKKARSVLEFVFSKGVSDADAVCSRIASLNDLNPQKKPRLTGDIAIRNLNKIIKKVTGRKMTE